MTQTPVTRTRAKTAIGTFLLVASLLAAFLMRDAYLPEVALRASVIGTVPAQAEFINCSADGRHYAFTLYNDHRMRMVIDGREGPEYGAVGFLRWRGGPEYYDRASGGITLGLDGSTTAYVAMRGEKYLVVHNGVESEEYDELEITSRDIKSDPSFWRFTLSPDGRHLAYKARLGDKWFMVIDDSKGPAYERILWGEYTSDSGHFAYAASKPGNQWVRVVDNSEEGQWTAGLDANRWPRGLMPRYPESPVRWAPGSPSWLRRIIWTLDHFGLDIGHRTRAGVWLVWRGARSPDYEANIEHVRLSPSGRHFAAIAHRGDERFLVVDAVERGVLPYRGEQVARGETFHDCAVYRVGDELVRVELEIKE